MSSRFVRNLAAKNILIPHINRYLEHGVFPDEWNLKIRPNKPPDDFFHPSSDCAPCEATLYAKFNDDLAPRRVDATSQKNFMVGHFWHIWLQTIIVEGLGFAEWDAVERKVTEIVPEWTALGHADVAPCAIPAKGEYLVDFKTMNSRTFKMNTEDPYLSSIVDKWKYQVNCYMAWTGLTKTIIVGIHKDSPHDLREFHFNFDSDLLDITHNKWYIVAEALKNGVVPECDCEDCPVGELYMSGY